jgi:hypothetical protein
MSVQSSGDEEIRGVSTDELLPGKRDVLSSRYVLTEFCHIEIAAPPGPAATAYLNAVFQRKSGQSTVDRTDETTSTLLLCENATLQSLTTTTSTTKTLSGSGNSIGAHRKPSTDLTSILSPGFSLDKKCVEQHHSEPQEVPRSSTSMQATNGSDTGSSSESDKLNKKKEPVEWKWNTNGVGAQFSEDDQQSSSKRARRSPREVIVHHDLEG